MPPANLMTNTTLVVVMTNALMDKVGANRLAERVHDGLAIAIRPTHTTHDGDAAFALSTGKVEAPFDLVGNIAVSAVVKAIQNGVRYAKTAANVPGLAG
jgi:L-aminopeptidase/D-esterase-like protein